MRGLVEWVLGGRGLVALVGVVSFLAVLLYPNPQGLSVEGQRMLAISVLALFLWISEVLPLAVTSFLVCVLIALLRVADPTKAFIGYGTHAMFFLIGAFVLGVAVQKTNLHRRIAINMLIRFRRSPTRLVLGVVFTGAGLSMLMPEHVVAAFMLPVLMEILGSLKVDLTGTNFSKAMMLGMCYGASVGSMGSLLGGARNPLAISIYQEVTGEQVSFFGWMFSAFPIVIVMTIAVCIVLKWKFPPEKMDLEAAINHMEKEIRKMGSMGTQEKTVLAIFLLAFLLWAFAGTSIGMATVAMLMVVLLFITKSVTWLDVQMDMPWGVVILYGGAVTMGKYMVSTGAASFIAEKFLVFAGKNPYLLLLLLIVMIILLTEVMSNAAATAVVLPIALTLTLATGLSPTVTMYTVAMGSAMAFMLVIATPGAAIAYSSGYLRQVDYLKAGVYLNLVGIAVLMIVAQTWWRLIGLH